MRESCETYSAFSGWRGYGAWCHREISPDPFRREGCLVRGRREPRAVPSRRLWNMRCLLWVNWLSRLALKPTLLYFIGLRRSRWRDSSQPNCTLPIMCSSRSLIRRERTLGVSFAGCGRMPRTGHHEREPASERVASRRHLFVPHERSTGSWSSDTVRLVRSAY